MAAYIRNVPLARADLEHLRLHNYGPVSSHKVTTAGDLKAILDKKIVRNPEVHEENIGHAFAEAKNGGGGGQCRWDPNRNIRKISSRMLRVARFM